jgi:hypothetical protein
MNNNKQNNKPKSNKPRYTEANIDRRIVACEMVKMFTLGAESKKNNPNRWTKEKRTAYNERVKMIQYLFNNQEYISAKKQLDWLDEDNQLTGRKFERPQKKFEKKPDERNSGTGS